MNIWIKYLLLFQKFIFSQAWIHDNGFENDYFLLWPVRLLPGARPGRVLRSWGEKLKQEISTKIEQIIKKKFINFQ